MHGLALYIRRLGSRHGTPKAFAKRCADHGMDWMALGGPWQRKTPGGKVVTGMMNAPDAIRRYADALYDRDVLPFVWGYPWQGAEEAFADAMDAAAGEYNLGLLDPEIGINPDKATRKTDRVGFERAQRSAKLVVELVADRFEGGIVGLSTYGLGVRMGWFPLDAFITALAKAVEAKRLREMFAGGQTYTKNAMIDRSIADFVRALRGRGQLVPNFGTYKRVPRAGKSVAVPKTPEELYSHLAEFIDEGEPVEALIGWAENFVGPELWDVLARFSDQMARGACVL